MNMYITFGHTTTYSKRSRRRPMGKEVSSSLGGDVLAEWSLGSLEWSLGSLEWSLGVLRDLHRHGGSMSSRTKKHEVSRPVSRPVSRLGGHPWMTVASRRGGPPGSTGGTGWMPSHPGMTLKYPTVNFSFRINMFLTLLLIIKMPLIFEM